MQLVQIGVTQQKTVTEFILELSSRQSNEIQQLKRSAFARAGRKHYRAKQHTHRKRASSSSS